MSHRPYDPFSPQGNWSEPVAELPSDQVPDNNEKIIEPIEVTPDDPEPDPEPQDAPPLPTPEEPSTASKPRRTRRTRKPASSSLKDALARLDGDT